MKKYIWILCLSTIPFVAVCLSHEIIYDLFSNPLAEIGSWIFSALVSVIIIIVAAYNMELNTKKRILLILLMPTLYVLPILLLLIIIIFNANWENFGLILG